MMVKYPYDHCICRNCFIAHLLFRISKEISTQQALYKLRTAGNYAGNRQYVFQRYQPLPWIWDHGSGHHYCRVCGSS